MGHLVGGMFLGCVIRILNKTQKQKMLSYSNEAKYILKMHSDKYCTTLVLYASFYQKNGKSVNL